MNVTQRTSTPWKESSLFFFLNLVLYLSCSFVHTVALEATTVGTSVP